MLQSWSDRLASLVITVSRDESRVFFSGFDATFKFPQYLCNICITYFLVANAFKASVRWGSVKEFRASSKAGSLEPIVAAAHRERALSNVFNKLSSSTKYLHAYNGTQYTTIDMASWTSLGLLLCWVGPGRGLGRIQISEVASAPD